MRKILLFVIICFLLSVPVLAVDLSLGKDDFSSDEMVTITISGCKGISLMKINNADGAVYWITGLSGAGKSSIGFSLYSKIRESKDNVIFLDGDMVRSMMGNDLGYDVVDRIKNAYRISNLCKFLSDQGHDIICSTMSLYPEVLDWNRGNIQRYFVSFNYLIIGKRFPESLFIFDIFCSF